jgi:glycerophosphoryl diester phosphodiesterase
MKQILLIALLSLSVNLQAQMKVIGHRGAAHIAPENTLISVDTAFELGSDAFEVDIHMTIDSQVMVIHDSNTQRTANGKYSYKVKDTEAEILHKIDVGSFMDTRFSSETTPYLSDVLALVPDGKILFIEIKCASEVIPPLMKVVQESSKQDQCVFLSFGWQTIQDLHQAFPENQCYYIKSTRKGLKKKMKAASSLGLNGVNINHRIINKRVMRRAEKLNLEVYCWTVNKTKTFDKMTKLGVNGVSTDRPGFFVGK